MRIVMWIAEILLVVWFFGCICTYQWAAGFWWREWA